MSGPRIVLASTSPYRAALLGRLLEGFERAAPSVDECERAGEPANARAARLSVAKATAVATGARDALVIGSDQVAAIDGAILHKPASIEIAREQLRASSGRIVHFYTGLCVVDSRTGAPHHALDETRVVFRNLSDAEIDRYLAREPALDCAGSFKVEGVGITLFERIESDDPTALIGLPLIALARLLRRAGVPLP